MRFNQRRFKLWALIAAMLAYHIAFFSLVGAAHVTWVPTPGPPPPQYTMYVSQTSETANRIAHIVFAPLIWGCEATGDFGYLDDASGMPFEGGPLFPCLWSVLRCH